MLARRGPTTLKQLWDTVSTEYWGIFTFLFIYFVIVKQMHSLFYVGCRATLMARQLSTADMARH